MKKKKKNLVQNLKWATAHLSRRLGAGRAEAWLGERARTGLAGGRRTLARAQARGTGACGASSSRWHRRAGVRRHAGGAHGRAGRGSRRGARLARRPGRGLGVLLGQ